MTACPNCGKEFAEGAFFCDNCGTKLPESAPVAAPVVEEAAPVAAPVAEEPAIVEEAAPVAAPVVEEAAPAALFCPNCGQQNSAEFAFCQNCGTALAAASAPAPVPQSESAPVPAPVEVQSESLPAPKKEKKPLPKKALLFGGIGLAAVAVVILLVALLSGGKSAPSYALYLKDGEIVYNDFGKDGGREISERLYEDELYEYMASEIGYASYVTEDGKTIIYPDRIGYDDDGINLYYRSLVKDDEAEKIDSEIEEYAVSQSGTLVTYLKGYDGLLYQYDMKKGEKEKLASDVDDFYVSEDGKSVVFYNFEGSLYYMPVGGDKEKLDSDVYSLLAARNNCQDIYYVKEGNLYYITPGEDRVKIASDIDDTYRIYDSGEIYYTTRETISKPYADFVVDDMAAADAAFVEPEWPDYPSWWDYDTDEEYDAAYEAYQDAVDAYYDAWDEWYEVQNRNYIREDLRDYTFDQDIYTLHYFDGSESYVVAENFVAYDNEYYFSTYDYALDTPMMVFKAQSEGEAVSVKISEIDSVWDVDDLVYESMAGVSTMYIASGSTTFPVEQNRALYPQLSDDGKTLYFVDDYNDEKSCGELYTASIGSDSCEVSLYDSDVSTSYLRLLDGGKKVLYFKDYEDGKGDLYVDGTNIDYDVYGYAEYDADNNILVYFTDYSDDYDREYGTLKLYDFKNTVKIDDDVHAYELLPNGDVLYLYDYSTDYEHGELYLYDGGKEPTKLDDDVIGIIPINNNMYRGIY